jgi:hypothetical protein
MEEQYPLILDGREAGVLSVKKVGGWTLFDVRCESAEGIVRVSAYGAEGEGYLGVLAPEGEALALCRRLSPGALRAFPGRIEYAGAAGAPGAKAAPENPPEPAAPENPPEPACEEEAPQAEPAEEPQAETEEPQPEAQTEAPPGIEDLYWYASPDGALVCFDGTENLIALPLGDTRIPGGGGGWRKRIEGRDYMVYRTKDGRLLR